MDTSEILKKVRKIEIKTKEISKHLFSGEYNSTFKGRGMSFSEVRDYTYGDDVRNIDWNVTARTGIPHVKIYEEERELTVVFLIDMSRSSFFGTVNQFKNEINAEIVATLAFSAMNNHDKVGAILYTDRVEKYIPPKKGRQHILRIIREMIYFTPVHTGTAVAEALVYLNSVIKKRSIAFILSDFFSDDYETMLKVAARKHDVIGIRMYDEMESQLPKVGLLKVRDAETGVETVLDTSSSRVRRAYEEQFAAHNEYFKQAFRRSGASSISINTREDYIIHLLRFFKSRHK